MTGWILTGLLSCLLAASALAATQATVVGGWLRLRSAPSLRATPIASYRSGTVVTLIRHYPGWYEVITPDGLTGYMAEEYLIQNSRPEPRRSAAVWTTVNQTAHVISRNGKGVRLRSSPRTGDNVLGLYPVGRTVQVLRQSSDGWSFLRIDKKHGYMMSEFLSIGSTDEMIPVDEARPVRSRASSSASRILSRIQLSSRNPRVGDRLSVQISPAGAPCTIIWYRDDYQVLSSSDSYTVRAGDAGHVIQVRVSGEGDGSGVNLNTATEVVRAAAVRTGSSGTGIAGSDASVWSQWGNTEAEPGLVPEAEWTGEDELLINELLD